MTDETVNDKVTTEVDEEAGRVIIFSHEFNVAGVLRQAANYLDRQTALAASQEDKGKAPNERIDFMGTLEHIAVGKDIGFSSENSIDFVCRLYFS